MAVGMADLLTYLPESNSNRPKILQDYRTMMATLKSWQNEEGLWNQLIDDPEAWTETSGSAMFTYAMITGVKNGWLDENEYAPVARKAWLGLISYLNDSFQIRNVCEGTNIGYTKEYYLERQRVTGDRHGQASMLWCAIALYETERNSITALKSLSYDYGILSPSFHPDITGYTCYLPAGIDKVNQHIETIYRNTAVFDKTVDVKAGNTSITVSAANGSTTKVYNVSFETGNDLNCTDMIVNSDFEYIAQDMPMTGETWKPKDSGTNQGYTQFYGWKCDLDALGGSSQGINKDFENHHGMYGCWISNSSVFPEFFEFYQTIDQPDAGTYKVQCLLSGTKMPTSQRLFANQNVQYFRRESDYPHNQTEGEIATFAGYPNPEADKNLSEMVVYTTIKAGDSLKIGIRTGSVKGDGSIGTSQWGWFKTDYFRLTKIDPVYASKADLSAIFLSAGSLDFSPEKTDYAITLPEGTRIITANAIAAIQDAVVTGTGMVNLSSGSGVSTITVTALDGVTTKTYTVKYTTDVNNNIDINEAPARAIWFVNDRRLIVKAVDAYTVYNINGVKIAEIKDAVNTAVELKQGVYIVRTEKNAETFKVVVK